MTSARDAALISTEQTTEHEDTIPGFASNAGLRWQLGAALAPSPHAAIGASTLIESHPRVKIAAHKCKQGGG
ncbi:hypothetical protein [Novipirellula artificiosorum]|uniref:hypothetical protein n=1 Tax=Novipirellula artificiosorum TaxID=2528016 RepID=UPI0011B53D80|nr:hypothetical protein [Novipirellula artificiosorum]